MIGNFKLAKKVTFMLPHYSSTPITIENVYFDRFNSIFKGFYLMLDAELTLDPSSDWMNDVRLKKFRSTERYGSQDIIELVLEEDLSPEQESVIKFLNYCFNRRKCLIIE